MIVGFSRVCVVLKLTLQARVDRTSGRNMTDYEVSRIGRIQE